MWRNPEDDETRRVTIGQRARTFIVCAATESSAGFPRGSSILLVSPGQVGIPGRLHLLGLPRHLRGVIVLTIMLSCIDPASEHHSCGMLSGEYSPASRQACLDRTDVAQTRI